MRPGRPLVRSTGLKSFTRISPKRAKPRRGPQRVPAFLAWVRSLGCVAPGAPGGCSGRIEAHHMGPRGLGQKAADVTAVPLCSGHHGAWHDARGAFRGWDHDTRARWAEAVIAETQHRWLEQAGRPESA